jgi:hypothetical protein
MWATDHLELFKKVIENGWNPNTIEQQLTEICDLDAVFWTKMAECEPRYDEASDRAMYEEVNGEYPRAKYESLINNLMRAQTPVDGTGRRYWFLSVEKTTEDVIRCAKTIMAARIRFYVRYAKDLQTLIDRTTQTESATFYS